MIKYISVLCLFAFLSSSFGIDRDSFNLVKPVVQSVPAHWIRTEEPGEVSDIWYHCPRNNLEWRRVAPYYIETRRVVTLPLRIPQMNFLPPTSFRPIVSSGSC